MDRAEAEAVYDAGREACVEFLLELAKTTAQLPAGIGASAFGANLQAALVTLTARNRISRRGMIELASDLFGVAVSTGTVETICQRVLGGARWPARPAA
jgi:hypothetical protein